MTDELITTAQAFSYDLLDEWKELKKFSKAFRENYVAGVADPKATNAYVVLLTRYWLELEPKIHENKRFGPEFLAKYESYRKYHDDPDLLDDEKTAFKLETVLREALEKLRITGVE